MKMTWNRSTTFAVCCGLGLMLAASGGLQWHNRTAPCPTDPALRHACLRTRKTALRVYGVSVLVYAVGGWFAFIIV